MQGSISPLPIPGFVLAAALLAGGEEAVLAPPFEVACGIAAGAGSRAGVPSPGGARILDDLPFSPSRGYGYVAGEAGRRAGAAAFGGVRSWPLAWREGPRKYNFRVPNGEYLVRLGFIECEVAEPGLRIFDVSSGPDRLLPGVDIAGEAGDFTWLLREGIVEVRDGWLDLSFIPAPGTRPPRISRIRVERAEGIPESPDPPESIVLDPGPLRVFLSWERPRAPGIAGFGVFRSASRDGPFESLTSLPLSVPFFFDERRSGDASEFFYRIRAYGLRGGQSPLSPPQAARPAGSPQGLRLLELNLEEAELRKLHTLSKSDPRRATPGDEPVSAVLRVTGASDPVEVYCLGEGDLWQGKKSYRMLLEPGNRRTLLGRREVTLLAEAGDPTLIREKLSAALDGLLGLPAPEVSYVHLVLNGRYQGIYLDREVLGRSFRRRSGLDPFGALAHVPGRLRLAPGGEPYGRTQGQGGNQTSLTHLVHELNRLDEGDLDAFFESRFNVDRLIGRLALLAIRGADPTLEGAEPPRLFLEDSRNGKFDLFEEDRRGGDFGIGDFQEPARSADGRRSSRSLFAWTLESSLGEGSGTETRWRVLESRLFRRPAFRSRYLERIEAILKETLTPERFDGMVSSARAPLLPALFPGGEAAGGAPEDAFLWPRDRGATFRASPAAVGGFFRVHREALLGAVAAERAREAESVCLNEFSLRPPLEGSVGGVPWIEIYNRSPAMVDLSTYFLTANLDSPRAFRLPPGSAVGPGERRVLLAEPRPEGAGLRGMEGAGPPAPIPCGLRFSPEGGEMGLFREEKDGRLILADQAFWGHQTAGFSCARAKDGADGWIPSKDPTPGAPNAGDPRSAPTWKYRSGIDVQKSGEHRLWLQILGPAESAAVYLREEGAASFEREDLSYNKELFRYEAVLGKERLGRRIEYYFSARSADGLERNYPLPGPEEALRVPVKPPLLINEILPRPKREGPFKEFVELYNASDRPIQVDGMFLTDDRRNTVKFRIAAKDPVPPRGFLLIHTDGRGEGTHANFRLGNAGEYVGLFASSREGNILIDQVVYPAIPVDRSYGRETDGEKGFKVWRDPTPGARNIPKIPPEALKKNP